MNTKSNWDELLNDYVDGVLSEADARQVEEALERDPDLLRAEQELRAIVSEAADLPRSIEPNRDLWPEIQERLTERAAHAPEPVPQPEIEPALPGNVETFMPRQRPLQQLMVAAAMILILAGAVLMGRSYLTTEAPGNEPNIAKETQPLPEPELDVRLASDHDQQIIAVFAKQEAEYAEAVSDLRAQLDEARSALAPETVQVIDENLLIINEAIAEIHEAMEQDKGNQRLMRTLIATYETELNLLEEATLLTESL
jgi:hypothetical protein